MVNVLDFGDEQAFYSLAEIQKFPVHRQLYFDMPVNPTALEITDEIHMGRQEIPYSLAILQNAGRQSRKFNLKGFLAIGCGNLTTETEVRQKLNELISLVEDSQNPIVFNFYLITEQQSINKIENAKLFVYINELIITEKPGTETAFFEYSINMIETNRL